MRSSRDAGLVGRILYIDLDTVIAGPLDDIAAFTGHFAALSATGMANERRPDGINSSVMSWDAGCGEAKKTHVIYQRLEESYSLVGNVKAYQRDFISMTCLTSS